MNTRETAAEYRLTHWAQVMHDRTNKGLTIREYCESVGIHQNTYFYWQHKLREAASSGIQAATTLSGEESLAPKGWATLCVSTGTAELQALVVEVSECRITVYADTNPELLTKVCRALKAL
jgi:transposase-like protein